MKKRSRLEPVSGMQAKQDYFCRISRRNIRQISPKLDTAGIAADLKKSWDRYGVSSASAKGKCIIAIISSTIGIKCQDELMETQIKEYATSLGKTYGTMPDTAMMECINIYHQGGASALKSDSGKDSKTIHSKRNLCSFEYGSCRSKAESGRGLHYTPKKGFMSSLQNMLMEAQNRREELQWQ